MRVLGINIVMDSWNKCDGEQNQYTSSMKSSSINAFFQRARDEQRVILTSSKSLRERAACPPSYFISPSNLEQALISDFQLP